MENYESIDNALNISDAEIVPSKKPILRKDEVVKINEIDKDYDHSDEIEDEADQILDFSEGNPFGLY